MFAAIVLAQALTPTPGPIATAQPAAASEREALQQVADDGAARARKLGGQLGVVIVDLGTGTTASRNADQSLPMQSVQKLPIALLVYREIDRGLNLTQSVTIDPSDLVHHASTIADNYPKRTSYSVRELLDGMIETSDNTAAKSLLRLLGGVAAANGKLVTLGFNSIVLEADDNGNATPHDLSRVLSGIEDGSLLSGIHRTQLLDQLAKATTFPGRLRAGFPKGTRVEHKTGTSWTQGGVTEATNDVGLISLRGRRVIIVTMLHDAKGDEQDRDGVIASVARGVYDATSQFPI